MNADFKRMLAEAKKPERSVPICFRGDLVAEHEALDRQLEQLARNPSDSMEGTGTADLVDRIQELELEMREHTYDVRLRALPRHQFRALVKEHGPRTDDDGDPIPEDRVLGVNRDTFLPALIRVSIVEPELTDEEATELLDETLTDKQWGNLADVAWFLNRGEVDVPFSRAASRARRNTDGE